MFLLLPTRIILLIRCRVYGKNSTAHYNTLFIIYFSYVRVFIEDFKIDLHVLRQRREQDETTKRFPINYTTTVEEELDCGGTSATSQLGHFTLRRYKIRMKHHDWTSKNPQMEWQRIHTCTAWWGDNPRQHSDTAFETVEDKLHWPHFTATFRGYQKASWRTRDSVALQMEAMAAAGETPHGAQSFPSTLRPPAIVYVGGGLHFLHVGFARRVPMQVRETFV